MDNIIKISLLLDFYGQFLTPRQYEIMDLHYNNDYTLSEIAEQFNITRQGVYDNIKRGKTLLDQYEKKLGLIKKFIEQKEKAREVLECISGINKDLMPDNDKIKLECAEEKLLNLINEF